MLDPKSNARLQRLLNGSPGKADDLPNLFLFARDRSDGREAVKEVGDFVAHHTDRAKGPITKSVRDFFAILAFHMPFFTTSGRLDFDLSKLPAITPAYLRATATKIHEKTLSKEGGVSKKVAIKTIEDLEKSLKKNADGTFDASYLSEEHHRLLVCLIRHASFLLCFDGEKLCDQLRDTLRSNGLLTRGDFGKYDLLRPIIQLFAVSVMHRCKIIIDASNSVVLKAMPRADGISIVAVLPTTKAKLKVGSCLFSADIPTAQHCEEDLLAEESWDDLDLELNDEGKLCILARSSSLP